MTAEAVTALTASKAVLEAREGGRPVAVVMHAGEDAPARRMLVYEDEERGSLGEPSLDEAARALGRELLTRGGAESRTVARGDRPEASLYGEAHTGAATLWVVGAGHIAQPLVRMAAVLGFRVRVLDDRDEFATETRFPGAAEVRRVDFGDPFAHAAPAPSDYVVLVTRAHRYDFDCLTRLVRRDDPPRYVGMVGSRRRVRAALGALLDAGVPRSRLAAIRAPIGVEIGAETPEEIAVSILAELVAERRDTEPGGALSRREDVLGRLLKEPGVGG